MLLENMKRWTGAWLVSAVSLFAIAISAAHGQFGETRHVTLTVDAPASVTAGQKFTVTVKIRIASDFHIQSNKPAPNYIPTTVTVNAPAGFVVGEPTFPPAELTKAAGEMIPVFSGTVPVQIPVTAPARAAEEAILQVSVRYQACDAVSCYPPSEATAQVRVQVRANSTTSGTAATDTGSSAKEPAPSQTAPSPGADSQSKQNGEEAPKQPVAQEQAVRDVPAPIRAEDLFKDYEMSRITQFVGPEEFIQFLNTGAAGSSAGTGRLASLLEGGNIWLALPLIFLLGLALNLTPCVYPIIPITISYFGSQVATSGRKPITLAIVYVLGMAVMYSALGVAAGLTGGLFGAQLQNPWVLLVFATIMFALALSQFDRKDGRPIWELQLPAAVRNRAQSRSGVLGALLMGVMVGVVAAPCIGPAVIALLQWVSLQQSAVIGFAVFFTLALGLGLPYLFLAAASGSVQRLPRSGEWMVGVKHVFGMVLVWMGVYYLQTVLALVHPLAPKVALVTVTALIAVYLLFLEKAAATVPWFAVGRRVLGIVALGLTIWLAMPAPPEQIEWRTYSDQALQEALSNRQPILIDFTAAWCAACRELEHKTFSDPRVGAAAKSYVSLRADMTNFQGPEAKRWQQLYDIKGLPTVVRLTPR